MENSGIYKITNKINNKAYIGLSRNVISRMNQHQDNYQNKRVPEKYLYFAFKEYGIENFTFEIIERCPVHQMSDRERFYIEKYNTYGSNGYNSSPGGEMSNSIPLAEKFNITLTKSIIDKRKSEDCKPWIDKRARLLVEQKSFINKMNYKIKNSKFFIDSKKNKLKWATKDFNEQIKECDSNIKRIMEENELNNFSFNKIKYSLNSPALSIYKTISNYSLSHMTRLIESIYWRGYMNKYKYRWVWSRGDVSFRIKGVNFRANNWNSEITFSHLYSLKIIFFSKNRIIIDFNDSFNQMLKVCDTTYWYSYPKKVKTTTIKFSDYKEAVKFIEWFKYKLYK